MLDILSFQFTISSQSWLTTNSLTMFVLWRIHYRLQLSWWGDIRSFLTPNRTGRCRSVLVFPDQEELRVGDPAVLVHVQLGHAARRRRYLHNRFMDNLERGSLRFIYLLVAHSATQYISLSVCMFVRSFFHHTFSNSRFSLLAYSILLQFTRVVWPISPDSLVSPLWILWSFNQFSSVT